MAVLPVPTIAAVIGEGGSGGALALGGADRIPMQENAIYSVIAPEGAAAILYRDAECAPSVADRLKLTATDCRALGADLSDRSCAEADDRARHPDYPQLSGLVETYPYPPSQGDMGGDLALGLRRGEALGLRWQDVDPDGAVLHVRQQLQRIEGKLELREPKTRKGRRTVALPAVAVAALRAHRARQNAERLALGEAWADRGLVFTSEGGTPIDPGNLKRSWHALRKRAKLDGLRFHDLRHGCATLLLAQGVHPSVVMETLGHSQISVAMNVYSHVLPMLQREAVDALDAALAAR